MYNVSFSFASEALKLHSYHQRDVASGFGHIYQAVIAGVVVIAAVEQVVGVQGDIYH